MLSCAYASSPTGRTWAVGADALAQISAAPECGGDGVRTVVREQAGVDRALLADKPSIKTTTTEPAAQPAQVLQESHGSAFLEPLVKVIGATGAAVGTAAGRAIICVATLGWRCGP